MTSHDPRTGAPHAAVDDSTPDEVRAVIDAATAATEAVAATCPAVRRLWLDAVADALQDAAGELVPLADGETALGEARLTAELHRTVGQLRFYGAVAAEGSFLGATIDTGAAGSPHLARIRRPLGPVAVFGASNFPFAFGVLGNDVASALAAGCPAVVKAHPAHPLLSMRTVAIAVEALSAAGAPSGVLGVVAGWEAGGALVLAAEISAVAFTGSQSGGLALWRMANQRERVIPVYAEMGTVNPVVVTPAAAATRLSEIAAGFVGSFTLGGGQYCTKPGILFAPAGSGAAAEIGRALTAAHPQHVMLTESIAAAAHQGVAELVDAGGVIVERVEGPGAGWSAPAVVLEIPIDALGTGDRLREEVFGPVALVAEYSSEEDLRVALGRLQGSLAASVMTAADGPDALAAALVPELAGKVGRVSVDEWPTGVATAWAQQHGGPWPATSAPWATSVGAGALDRFVRPVVFQSAPDAWLPPGLQASNPWLLPRRIDGVLVPAPEGKVP